MTTFGGKGKNDTAVSSEKSTITHNQQQVKQLEFELSEAFVFEIAEELRSDFIRGQFARCSEQREWAVKVYPTFKSSKPLYGSVHFSGRAAENKLSEFYFAIDESGGTGKGYDTLYFDQNGDLNLTNDTKLMADPNPPSGALLQYSSIKIKQQVCFDKLNITFFAFGPDKRQSIEIMPRFLAFQDRTPQIFFVPTKLHKGEIEINGAKYDAFLGYTRSVGGPLDQPGAGFYFIPKGDPQNPPRWWGGDTLQAMHFIGGKYYRFASTPTGDKLFVRPYDGSLGTFEVGPGGRDIKEVSMRGSLRSQNTAVAVGGELERGWPKPAQNCQIPVGDYLPSYLRITLGRLSIFISDNYHSDGKPRVGREPKVYGIKIREDKPYVFDFSNKPDVLFASPAKEHRVKLGEELLVKAVLIDPNLNIMIRGLDDTTRKQKKEYIFPDGKKQTGEKIMSLDPKVVITRADGEIVAEGVMPFGWDGTCGYSWRVPKDLRLAGKQEPFNIEVLYDTLELYGKVTATRQIIVYQN